MTVLSQNNKIIQDQIFQQNKWREEEKMKRQKAREEYSQNFEEDKH